MSNLKKTKNVKFREFEQTIQGAPFNSYAAQCHKLMLLLLHQKLSLLKATVFRKEDHRKIQKKIVKLMVRKVATDIRKPQIRAFLWKICSSWKHHTSGG